MKEILLTEKEMVFLVLLYFHDISLFVFSFYDSFPVTL